MEDGYSHPGMLLLIGLILLEACLYGFWAAVQNMNRGKLEQDKEAGNKRAGQLLDYMDRPSWFTGGLHIMPHLAGMITGFCLMAALEESVFKIAAFMLLFLIVLVCFGVLIPRQLGRRSPEKWSFCLLPIVHLAGCLFFPLTVVMIGFCRLLLKLVGIDMAGFGENVTEEDIMSMVNEGHEQGVVEADEAEMITNIFQMNDKEAHDIMTHRANIVAIDSSMTLGEAVNFILKEGSNSRYPVYEKELDNIIGILHMKDALLYADDESNINRPISEIYGILREAHFIPETRSIDTLFHSMQAQKIHLVVVVDEYGQTAGIVTMEDILEEIVGNILDEYDEEEKGITSSLDGTFLIDGKARLEQVEQELGITFVQEDAGTYETINGFLISRLNRIPEEGEELGVCYQGYEFQIVKVENKMIQSVQAKKLPEGSKEAEKIEGG